MDLNKTAQWFFSQGKGVGRSALIVLAFLIAFGVSIDKTDTVSWLSNACASDAQILDISVTNCYAPYIANPMLAKIVLVFNSDYPVPSPSEISSISVTGPEGIKYRLRNAPYDRTYFNGYLYDPNSNVLWYQAYWNSFIPDGEYSLVVQFTDGDSRVRGRYLQTNYALLGAYLAYQQNMMFYPSNGAQVDGSSVMLQWKTMAEMGGPSAYYNSWLVGTGTGLMLSDSIFTRSKSDSAAGLDRNWSWRSWPSLPAGNYRWFTEILDSNVFSEINMVIFQPWQEFVVE